VRRPFCSGFAFGDNFRRQIKADVTYAASLAAELVAFSITVGAILVGIAEEGAAMD
jgi:hypothetical protein